MELSNTTHERNSEDVSHLDIGEGNSVATGQIQVLDRDTNHALTVRAAFDPLSAMADEWMERARLIHVTSIEQAEDMAFARESRLGLRKVVGTIERTRKEMKADALQRGRDIDKIAGALEDRIRPVMEHLREQEEFAIRYEAARLAGIRSAREAELVALGTDPRLYTDLASVSDDGYAQILAIAKTAHDAKVEAARLAEVARVEEAQRIAAAKEAERLERAREDAARLERERAQAEENALLKVEREAAAEALRRERAERDAAEARFAAEREAERRAAEHAQAIRDEALRIEREAAAAIARAEREERDRVEARLAAEREAERQAAAHAAWLAAEAGRLEREKVEAVARKAKEEHDALLRRIADQEHRAKLEAAAEKERAEALAEEARLAPDRKKLERLALDLQTISRGGQITIVIPVMATDAGRAALGRILVNFGRLANSIVKEAGGL